MGTQKPEKTTLGQSRVPRTTATMMHTVMPSVSEAALPSLSPPALTAAACPCPMMGPKAPPEGPGRCSDAHNGLREVDHGDAHDRLREVGHKDMTTCEDVPALGRAGGPKEKLNEQLAHFRTSAFEQRSRHDGAGTKWRRERP